VAGATQIGRLDFGFSTFCVDFLFAGNVATLRFKRLEQEVGARGRRKSEEVGASSKLAMDKK
jgi:hypothetical protein